MGSKMGSFGNSALKSPDVMLLGCFAWAWHAFSVPEGSRRAGAEVRSRRPSGTTSTADTAGPGSGDSVFRCTPRALGMPAPAAVRVGVARYVAAGLGMAPCARAGCRVELGGLCGCQRAAGRGVVSHSRARQDDRTGQGTCVGSAPPAISPGAQRWCRSRRPPPLNHPWCSLDRHAEVNTCPEWHGPASRADGYPGRRYWQTGRHCRPEGSVSVPPQRGAYRCVLARHSSAWGSLSQAS